MTQTILSQAQEFASSGQFTQAVSLLTNLEINNQYDEQCLLHKCYYLSKLEKPEEMFVTAYIGERRFKNPLFNAFKGQALGIIGEYEASIEDLQIAAEAGDQASRNNLTVSRQQLAEIQSLLKMKSLIGQAPVFLSSVFFVSTSHKRYENGTLVSDSPNVHRAIRIEDNINGGSNYSVTIYSLENPHPLWRSYIQMGTKQMKIVEERSDKVIMRGYGQDDLGNSFSDYGIEISNTASSINSITLTMFDRNVSIKYFK